MGRKWRTAIIGAGVIGNWHAGVIDALEETELVAICDLLPEKGKALIEKRKLRPVPVYASVAQMLAAEKLDSVHVCTPSGNHQEPAVEAMERGINVVCEKPLEITPARIDRMIEASQKHKVKLAGIFQNRWNESHLAMKQALDAGRFGTLAYAGCYTPWYRSDEYYRDGGWRGTWKLDGGGAIMNQSVHAVDMLQWFAGPVKRVTAHASSRIHPEIEVEDTLVCSLTFRSGAFGVIMGSTAMYPGIAVRYELGGAHGTAVAEGKLRVWKFRDEQPGDADMIDRMDRTARTDSGGGTSNTDIPFEFHIRNIRHIYQSWEQGREPDTHAMEARKAIEIIVAMYDSARRGGEPIDLPG